VSQASPTITDNVITQNHGCFGSGIFAQFAAPLIQRNVITENQRTTCSGVGGGGVSRLQGEVALKSSDNEISYNVVLSGSAGWTRGVRRRSRSRPRERVRRQLDGR